MKICNSLLFFVLLTIAMFSQSLAQGSVEIVTFDFNTKRFTDASIDVLDTMEEGDYYQVKVININLNQYTVSINSTDSILSQKLETPGFGIFGLEALEKAVSGIIAASTTANLSGNQTENYTNYKIRPSSVENNNNNADDEEEEWNKRLIQELIFMEKSKSDLELIKTKIENLKFEIMKYRMDALASTNGRFNYSLKLTEVQQIRNSIEKIRVSVADSKLQYLLFLEKTPANTDPKKNMDKAIQAAYGQFMTTVAEVKASVSIEKTIEVLEPNIYLAENQGKNYLSFPIQFRGETGSVTLKIEPRDAKYLGQKYGTTIRFPEEKRNYVSIGLSFYGSGLYDVAWSTVGMQGSDSVEYSLVQEDTRHFEFGTVALMRFGSKFEKCEDWGGHFSFGPALSIGKNIRPRLALGGGITYGKRHMLALDFGGMIGHTDVLSNVYSNTEQTYSEKPENVVVSQLNAHVFFSIGYTFKL